ncbi:glycosyltransferase [Sediminispirochaeta smaragdinae]|uniref:Glycosyl transferase family 2 n=1 Tax=Sediminispirochaeta smaragdinae (strain DSM 11293 / JCM 15392 / SEBR 4228) TaxID=573413 RepID=E1R851_SEDSS|nr:glycosyltransferase [Sediminispirochaeta smaragdinae]ADK82906.1 glycosyl transferase family 2 [Sediminispirochaeta smaragdinae DSM 11293]
MISVVIPSYNGAATLVPLCRSLSDVLRRLGLDREIIVVLDGSSDESRDLLVPLIEEGIVDVLCELPVRSGQQRATLEGILRGRGSWFLTLDDDFGHRPEDVEKLLAVKEGGANLVFGVPERGRRSSLRNLGSSLRSTLFHLASGRKKLIPSSFRLFSRSCARSLFLAPAACRYLSVELVRHSRKAESLLLTAGGATATIGAGTPPSLPGTSRHPASSLVRGTLSLASYLLPWRRDPLRSSRRALLVVGAGGGQLGLIRRAKKRSLIVAVSDRDSSAPGVSAADYFLSADTFDGEQSIAACIDAMWKGIPIRGVATAGTDQPVLTVSLVADHFLLPGALRPEIALAVTNKRVMKRRLEALGLPTLPWSLIGEETASAADTGPVPIALPGFPAVLKPVDSQGQRGVVRVESEEELYQRLSATLACSREAKAMVETFYPADEVTFSGWVEEGRLVPLLLTDRATLSSGPHIGICPAHRYPSLHAARSREVFALCDRFVRGFPIPSGPIYVQLLVGEEGIKINELACRIGGAYEELLIPALTGVDILDLQIDLAIEGRLSPQNHDVLVRAGASWPPEGFASVILAFAQKGVVRSIGELSKIRAVEGVVDGGYLLAPGRRIGELENSTGRAAWAVVRGKSAARVNRSVEGVYDALEVIGDSGENLMQDLRSFALHPDPLPDSEVP